MENYLEIYSKTEYDKRYWAWDLQATAISRYRIHYLLTRIKPREWKIS